MLKATDIRPPGKAGSWYESDKALLSQELERNLNGVDAAAIGCDGLPVPGARIIIAPHAGYEYSGECAAWAYGCLDLSRAKRVFVLGPSHVAYLTTCAVTQFTHFATPLGTLKVDELMVNELKARAGTRFQDMQRTYDLREHSLELHMPYLYKRLQQTFGPDAEFPPVVPIVIGSLGPAGEKEVGRLLAPYLRDPGNSFIVSSDFCHWGDNFDYAPYSRSYSIDDIKQLGTKVGPPTGYPSVEDTIELVDRHALDAIKSGSHDAFVLSLRLTGNTVCGRVPIGVILAALEVLAAEDEDGGGVGGKYRFRETKYTTSGRVKNDAPIANARGHSVSYVSAYALL